MFLGLNKRKDGLLNITHNAAWIFLVDTKLQHGVVTWYEAVMKCRSFWLVVLVPCRECYGS